MNWRVLVPLGSVVAVGCALLQPRFETISPEYGYVDGCTDVKLSGANIGTDATVTIGGESVTRIAPATEDTASPEWAQDIGFEYTGVTPPAPGLEPGIYDVVMTVPVEEGKKGDPVERSILGGFLYLACPESVHIDGTSLGGAMAPGGTVQVEGCGLDAEQVTARLFTSRGEVAATLAMTSLCSTASVELTLPATLADGVYWLGLEHADGSVVGGVCGAWQDTGGVFSGDTDVVLPEETGTHSGVDTASPCGGTFPVIIRGAE